ncbi:Glutaredoxin-C6 [Symbiodinium microadriaticum]|uniref:Glutaredoxin-C6 n=1 Tax=Symbiodinium microadriaticum TaxID=2951 RepID=A0A1Q9C3L8_SYMMI|nr:Glutaredoxin-C6 [Symbiodinium microadriaticum]
MLWAPARAPWAWPSSKVTARISKRQGPTCAPGGSRCVARSQQQACATSMPASADDFPYFHEVKDFVVPWTAEGSTQMQPTLARLIQHQHQALAHESAREAVGRSGSRPSSQRGAEASPSSSRSGFSGFSSNSAPARLPGPSPQVRLKDYCDSVERLSKANDRRRWAPPRPRLPSGSSTGSTRPYSSSSRGSDRGPGLESCSSTSSVGNAAAKRAAGGARKASGKPPKAASFEEQRRARIRHMQRLYGLGQAEEMAETQPTVVEPQNSQRGGEPTAVEASPVQRQPFLHKYSARLLEISSPGLCSRTRMGSCKSTPAPAVGTASEEPLAKMSQKAEIEEIVGSHKVVVIAKSWCPFCTKVNVAFQSLGVSDLKVVEADHRPDELDFMEAVKEITEKKSVPQVFVGGKFIPGGCDNIMDLREKGELKPLLQEVWESAFSKAAGS